MPTIALSPAGRLFVEGDDLAKFPALYRAFEAGSGSGLLYLDDAIDSFLEEPSFAYWRDFARKFFSMTAALSGLETRDVKVDPIDVELPKDDTERLILIVPPMKGAEYLNRDSITAIWREMGQALNTEIIASGKGVAAFFALKHASLNLLGRVCFHLAENKRSEATPFAFLATYAHQVSSEGKTQHLPLNRALEEYGGSERKAYLLRLLSPLQKASQESVFLKRLIDDGDIYQTLAWTAKDAHSFLKDIPVFEKSGIAVRVPNWWQAKRPNRAQVALKLGDKKPAGLGLEALLDFSVSVILNDEELSQKEIQELLNASENLVFFKGQWVEVDRERLQDLLGKWKSAAKAAKEGLSFGEAMRLLAGVDGEVSGASEVDSSTTRVISGKWLAEALENVRSPEQTEKVARILKSHLKATLRPYQEKGVAWLSQLGLLQLGGVLADDMGLGKTIQIISFLIVRKSLANSEVKHLLVVPASLLGNWQAELLRFAPSLQAWIAHPSGEGYLRPKSEEFDIVITTYGSLTRAEWIKDCCWSTIIADEAQAIKNPGAKQTKALKGLKSQQRFALTGTPVENHLSDLWSLFDFVSPGLLGSSKEFETFLKRKGKSGESPYAAVRKLVKPYILRRLKTDKSVIQDLPEKTEIKSYCQLSKAQAALYQKSVESLGREIEGVEGIKRRGVVLSYLMRLKQICNHPSQFVKDGRFSSDESGKFQRLKEICEIVADKQEKVLVFTQFKEMTDPLHQFLASVFGQEGLVLHGETSVKKRSELVADFQRDVGPPYFVLSLKAGGTGLNLTQASHVIHFDRWWNPAVENQATDRAFRIGQKKNVLVHKFICRGTLEEKIDALLESKRVLSNEILEDTGAAILTELGNDELLKIVALDINSAVAES